MLWATPYFFTNFVRLPLGTWKIAQSIHVEEILKGANFPISWYARDYPGSFVFNGVLLQVTGFDPLWYVNRAYPVLEIVSLVLLIYVLISRIFDRQIALLSTLFMIPGMHYVILQPAPSTYGLMLFISSLICLSFDSRAATIMVVVFSSMLIISHPVYALLLLLFLLAALIVGHFRHDLKLHLSIRSFTCTAIFFILWESFSVAAQDSVFARLGSFSVLNLLSSLFGQGQATSVGVSVFANIDLLAKVVYLIYFLSATIFLAILLFKSKPDTGKIFHGGKRLLQHFTANQIWVISGVLIAGLTGVYLYARTPDEAERSVFLFILLCSSLVASGISTFVGGSEQRVGPLHINGQRRKKVIAILSIALFSSLTLLYPVVSYSVDSYSNFPTAEETGLKFLSAKYQNQNLLILVAEGQFLLYCQSFHLVGNDPWVYAKSPEQIQDAITKEISASDIIVLRKTAFFYSAIKLDHSFDDNRFILTEQALESNLTNNVYSTPSLNIYVRTNGS